MAEALAPMVTEPNENTSQQPLNSLTCSTTPQTPPTHYSTSEMTIFKNIMASGCSIKSQQRGETDLSETELCSVLHNILLQKPGAFLTRFGQYLEVADLSYFDSLAKTNFEVEFRVGELRKSLNQSSKSSMKTINNRRYKYLEKLMEGTDYFLEEQMRQRDPLLFEYYIGQFMSAEEKEEMEKEEMEKNKSDMTLSSMILKNIEVDKRTVLLKQQRRRERDQLEETDSSSDEDDDDDDDQEKMSSQGASRDTRVPMAPMKLSSNPEMAKREKRMLRTEFLSAMQNSFLEGKDKDFDYSVVDQNEAYDSLDMKQKDAEDVYFDTEEEFWHGPSDKMDVDSGDKQDVTNQNGV